METTEALMERRGQCTLLANVLLTTQKMLQLAREGDWDTIVGLEAERRDLLGHCFENAVPPEHSELFAEALAAMLHLNEELLSELDQAKAQVGEQRAGLAQGRRGVGHYLDIEPLG